MNYLKTLLFSLAMVLLATNPSHQRDLVDVHKYDGPLQEEERPTTL